MRQTILANLSRGDRFLNLIPLARSLLQRRGADDRVTFLILMQRNVAGKNHREKRSCHCCLLPRGFIVESLIFSQPNSWRSCKEMVIRVYLPEVVAAGRQA